MAQPYVGEIRMFAGNFAPAGWAFCNGDLMSISENETLFQLIGTTYGGDGESTFALPNLQSRVPIHMGTGPGLSNYQIGESFGTESVTITSSTTPAHTHVFLASTAIANQPNPANNYLGVSSQVSMYFGDPPNVPMNPSSLSNVGGSQPHENCMPFLCVSFIISLYGIFPSPT
ncbi:MAG: phage tail protein [Saprospiraceae bacterium]|nr:phage tail protein [Saprospiraceae bacterium]